MLDELINNAHITDIELAQKFDTSLALGLSSDQITQKKLIYGLNEIKNEKAHPFLLFLKQFSSPFVIIFLIIGIISLITHEYINGAVILSCIFINIFITRWQEHKSESYLNALKKYLLQSESVIRDGKTVIVSSRDLIPGDIILLKQGDILPADVRFIEVNDVTIDQSTLTGESNPIIKTAQPSVMHTIFDAANIGFSGSAVINGQAKAMVLAIGKKTYFNQNITDDLSIKESDFHKKIDRFSFYMTIVILLAVCTLFFLTLFFKSHLGFFNIFIFATALALSITPEALPALVTFALSRAVTKLTKSNIIVKRFSALQDMGSMEVLCVDKTGTLTENKLTVSEIVPYKSGTPLFYAALVNSTPPARGFDEAIVQALSENDLDALSLYNNIYIQSFDAAKRRNFSVLHHKKTNEYICIARGSFESIASSCNESAEDVANLNNWILQESRLGKRSLAVGYKIMRQGDYTHHTWANEDNNLTLAGCISFQDPIKKTTPQTIVTAKKLGVQLKILSGDMKEVCAAVATELNLIQHPAQVIAGDEYMSKPEEEKDVIVRETVVFARMLPEQKFDVLKRLQKQQLIVGYLGDGMNDIPALSVADIAITVENALDIVRDTADIILLKKSLMAIITGIKESRTVFSNITTYMRMTIASNFGDFFALGIASFILPYLPMLPIHIITVNFLTDFPSFALATDSPDLNQLQKPQKFNLLSLLIVTVILGLLCMVLDLSFFFPFKKFGQQAVQSGYFILNMWTEIAFILCLRCRTLVFNCSRPSNILLALSMIVAAIAVWLPFSHIGQTYMNFVPLTVGHISIVGCITLLYIAAIEGTKSLLRAYHFM
jgi:Mg2+-importing ATPase